MLSRSIRNTVVAEQKLEGSVGTGHGVLWGKRALRAGNKHKDAAVEARLVCSRESKKYFA